MELIRSDLAIDFVARRRMALVVSGTVIAIALASLLVRGLNWGIDFRGGTMVQIRFDEATRSTEVHDALADLGRVQVQSFEGSDREFLVRLDRDAAPEDGFSEERVRDELVEALGTGVTVVRVELVGPKVGAELKRKGMLSVVYAMGGVLIYIWVRFQIDYGIGAIAALIHDVIITLGAFSIAGREFNLPVVAAVLAIVGYSLNDTIIVYDRIREVASRRRRAPLAEVINEAVNSTLSRTVLTSFTTLITVVVLFVFGGGVIHDFAFALLVGIVVGTYSSIFVASPILIWWRQVEPELRRRFGGAKARA